MFSLFKKRSCSVLDPIVVISRNDEAAFVDVKFYKPTVQPKKMKIQNIFPESQDENKFQDQKLFGSLCINIRGGNG